MINIDIIKYALEILEVKLKVIDCYWKNQILSPTTSRVTEVSRDMTIYNFVLTSYDNEVVGL